MDLGGQTLRVVSECELLQVGEAVYCIKDCPETRVFIIWSNRLIFGVNQIKLPYERRKCFEII